MKSKHEIFIKEVRSKGLMAAIEFKNNHDALKVYNKIAKDGLVTTLIQGNTIRITPPLVIEKKDLIKGIEIISTNIE